MKIEVRQGHIDRGKPKDCNKCPVALAMRDSIAECITATVENYGLFISSRNGLKHFLMPKEVARFVNVFDEDDPDFPAKPFTFELNV